MNEKAAYEKFKLVWMIEHGYSLSDLIRELDELREESAYSGSVSKLFESWELDCGFGSEIWPCYQEFIESDYPLIKEDLENF